MKGFRRKTGAMKKEPFNIVMSVVILLLVVLLAGIILLGGWAIHQFSEGKSFYRKLIQSAITETEGEIPIQVDFAALEEISGDIRGWLYCPDTSLHYPVMQAAGASFYRKHLPDGSKNFLGSICFDNESRDGFADDNTLLYGNYTKNGSMFSCLKSFLDKEFRETHPVLYYLERGKAYQITVVNCVETEQDSVYYERDFETQEDWEAYLEMLNITPVQQKQLLKEQKKQTGVKQTEEEQQTFNSSNRIKIVTLSTNTYEKEHSRLILQGVLMQLQ